MLGHEMVFNCVAYFMDNFTHGRPPNSKKMAKAPVFYVGCQPPKCHGKPVLYSNCLAHNSVLLGKVRTQLICNIVKRTTSHPGKYQREYSEHAGYFLLFFFFFLLGDLF